MKTNKGKHLTLDDRIEIQECLSRGVTFKTIGQRIGKDQTTVSKEVKRHIKVHRNSFVNREDCCPRLLKAPFVCNGCQYRTRSSCHYPRHIYDAKSAQQDYETLLREAREGIPLTRESFYQTEQTISDAVRRGQHIYHAIQTYNLPVSIATVYRHIHKGYYTIANIDLPRAVKFKPRQKRSGENIPKALRNGRTFEEFETYCQENGITSHVELDTVIGRPGGKVIMTIHFTAFNFMFGLLMENRTAAECAAKITGLKQTLQKAGFSFAEIFPLLLTDNGGEFSCVQAIEEDIDGSLSKLFFCNPSTPSDKPQIEKNHTMMRDILPKGSSFDHITQEDVNLVFSHVNAVKRKDFNGKSAYDLFCFSYSQALAAVLGISYVPAEEVIQTPKLLKK